MARGWAPRPLMVAAGAVALAAVPPLALVAVGGLAVYGVVAALVEARRRGPGEPRQRDEPRLGDIPLATAVYLGLSATALAGVGGLTGRDLLLDDAEIATGDFVLADLLDATALVAAALLFMRARYGRSLSDDGFAAGRLAGALGLGAIVGGALWFLTAPVDLVMAWLTPGHGDHPLVVRLGSAAGVGNYTAVLLSGCLLAPLAEELFFRGLVFRVLVDRLGLAAGTALSSALFAAAHASLTWSPGLVVTGAGLALLYAGARSLPAAMAAHAVVNLLTFASMRLP